MNHKNALLLSGYHALSQKHWAEFVVHNTDFNWQLLALPARYFSWRMRGAPLSFAALDEPALAQPYDFLVATSSVDLATVQSLYPALRNIPSLLYFHENQFAYPKTNQPKAMIDWQMVNLYSALRADYLVFNSQFNQQSFLTGVTELMRKLPDLVPKGITEKLADKSSVLAVPIVEPRALKPDAHAVTSQTSSLPATDCKTISSKALEKATKASTQDNGITVLWNHRWEWDKNPALLLEIIKQVNEQALPIRFVLTGQQFRTVPTELQQIEQQFAHLIKQAGFIEQDEDYRATLQQCDVVLSTADHEFQGIAVMEAVSEGCVPLLPNRLSYPEFFDANFLYNGQKSIHQQATSAVKKLKHWLQQGLPCSPDLSSFYQRNLTSDYQQLLNAIE
ncbi:tRNA-queuosine alpha-mannosyltransferase domain-containing protein [Reinekea thalattae]|uniref:tRNA-queuosine alpha-mannosyltransferase n=1 Tax=Reinekea thalattae TaxID=2593301 RepID=A0A5C8Z8K9_9GAMM|nr:DUF3524 domain-containing protein [Reinekea thalattae]TXR53180.1 DUF3524 domain-containing protein [Reinekea thalattae]